MGLLSVGTPLSWEESKKKAEDIKLHGIVQFINLYNKFKEKRYDILTWGYEIEYTLVYLDHVNKSARLHLKCADVLPKLQSCEEGKVWRMEYADYMLEGVPANPFRGCLSDFNEVEGSMKALRKQLAEVFEDSRESVICFAAFPRIGCPRFTEPIIDSSPDLNLASKSLYFPDRAVYPDHPRFITLTKNIRSRRGKRQAINVPIYRDRLTPKPYLPPIPNDDGEAKLAIKNDHVYMDCMGFGMGCCCLQLTLQTCNIDEARFLYDQLAVMAPIMLALSAASPAYQGTLTDADSRWNVISNAVDDRTCEELGEKPLKDDKFRIPKSRYDCIDMYISDSSKKYNDLPIYFEENHKKMLVDAGIDEVLADHIAHLFIRDPISLFAEKLNLDDEVDIDHFQNIQSTNWQTMRFKPPTNTAEGWRVEFRPMDVQLTEFENSAYVTFIVLLTRIILSFDINFLVPISKVEHNMKNAVKRNAVLTEKFYFRNFLSADEGDAEMMSIDTIINGNENDFPGLIPLIRCYITSIGADVETSCTINRYLTLISKRASGTCKTMATWMRDFIRSHPDYEEDSRISERVNYDLSVLCDKISRGSVPCPELFGAYTNIVDISNLIQEEVQCVNDKILDMKNDRRMRNGLIGVEVEKSLNRSIGVDGIKVTT